MAEPWLITAAMVAGVGFALAGLRSRKARADQFERDAEQDPLCVSINSSAKWGHAYETSLEFKRGPYHLELTASHDGAGNNRADVWRACGGPVRLAERARFTIKHEHLLSKAAGLAGFEDIHLGEAALDDELLVKGNNEDVIRAALLVPKVKEALVALTHGHGSLIDQRLVLALEAGNTLTYQVRRHGLSYDDARHRADGLLRLIEGLDEARDIAPMRARLDGGVGTGSGSPVGVSVLDDRKS